MEDNEQFKSFTMKSFNDIKSYVGTHSVGSYTPSKYWDDESSSLEYIFSANWDLISRLRDHTHWLTGVRSYDYKDHHRHMANKFENKLNKLRKVCPNLEMFGEVGVLGDFGHPINGELYNIDTLKFVESCIALEKFGILSPLKAKASPLICEIGAGWGGFISHLIRHLPRARFIIVDLPATLLFSATYLPVAFPEKTVGFLGSSDFTGEEDIIFSLPDIFLKSDINNLDLVVNMVSFQEMTSEQVSQYSEKIRNTKCQYIYSLNRKVSNHNPQLTSVNESLIDWQIISEVKPLSCDYTFIEIPKTKIVGGFLPRNIKQKIHKDKRLNARLRKILSQKYIDRMIGKKKDSRNYRHLLLGRK